MLQGIGRYILSHWVNPLKVKIAVCLFQILPIARPEARHDSDVGQRVVGIVGIWQGAAEGVAVPEME